MRAEINFGPVSKHKLAIFFARAIVRHPRTDVVMEASYGRNVFRCGDMELDLSNDITESRSSGAARY